nr:MAG TPA: hypothetical protein [Ackermannviridae sp.]
MVSFDKHLILTLKAMAALNVVGIIFQQPKNGLN